MSRQARRLEALERAAPPLAHPPAFILAVNDADADRQIARNRADYPDSTRALFVMITADHRS
jgi:hypothetical protein